MGDNNMVAAEQQKFDEPQAEPTPTSDAPQPIKMTEAEYFAFEDASETKHEYAKGYVYAMAGATVRHNTIINSISLALGIQIGDRDCTINTSDTKIQVSALGHYRYPDVVIFCGEPQFANEREDMIRNPIVLVEVLSDSTALTDRDPKLLEYTQIDTLQTYLLVSQDEPRIERYQRTESGDWLYSSINGLDGEVALPAIDCKLALSKVYQKVSFEDVGDDASKT